MTSPNSRSPLVLPFQALALATALLSACGGGGDSSPAGAGGPTVSAATVGSAAIKYGRTLVLIVNGSGLDQGVTLASPVCANPSLLTAAPTASNANTAYFACTPSGSGDVKILRTTDGATLATVAIVVPVPQVTIDVSNGAGVSVTMVITLAPDKAPRTVDNFLGYVNSGFYVGTIVHRVVPGFVVQAGGYVAPLSAAPGTLKAASAPIALEAGKGLSNQQWAIAMARSADPNSATSQFFIDLVDNSNFLDPSPVNGPGYAVFGMVTGGTSAVTAIVNAPCTSIPLFNPAGECTPTPNMVITSAVQTQ